MKKSYMERHFHLDENTVLSIVPNSGRGECLFHSIAYAKNGKEDLNGSIKLEIVNYIIYKKWKYFHNYLKIQHLTDDDSLKQKWKSAKYPQLVYKRYMIEEYGDGTMCELVAASDLYGFNFGLIEVKGNIVQVQYYKTRKKNRSTISSTKLYHFLLTVYNSYNGHWEFVKLHSNTRNDVYKIDKEFYENHSLHIIIEGKPLQTNIEEWLQNYVEQSIIVADVNTALIKTNLFSVLSNHCVKNSLPSEIFLKITNAKKKRLQILNWKIFNQPWENNFTISAIKYSSYPAIGNIQDLVCASENFDFTFTVTLFQSKCTFSSNFNNVISATKCSFVHIDKRKCLKSKNHFNFGMKLISQRQCVYSKFWIMQK